MNKLLKNGIIKTEPRRWTREMEREVLELRSGGLSSEEIAKVVGRSQVSVSIKLKRLSKSGDTYNKKHRQDKYKTNKEFLELIKPKNVLDVYAGNTFYEKNVTTNDKDEKYGCDYSVDAFDLLCKMNLEKKKFDIVDLDPYGSAIDVFPLALKIARKGIVITLGEMGHRRWKRLDFVRRWYGINRIEDFTSNNIIKKIQEVGLCYKKELVVFAKRDYNLITRVWFSIKEYKITEQWDGRRKN
jgi:hypothetical protein